VSAVTPQPVSTEADDRPDEYELMRRGGEWLGVARNWIQWNCRNGESVTWGSRDVLERSFTVADIEQIAAKVAASAMKPQPNEARLSVHLKARWAAERERDEAKARVRELERKNAWLVAETKRALLLVDNARSKLSVATASRDDVWHWQGAGDYPESLSCPVVMSAETLRDLLARGERQ
jgi:hypothetical protein